MRAVYADTLIEMMQDTKDVVCLEADLGRATGTHPKVSNAFPERFINVGVAEANMIGIAAGLASEGKIPFCASFSSFASRRCYDQFTVSAAYAKNNIKVVGTAPGITQTVNGGTHMCFQDLAIMRAVPGIHLYSPADAYELRAIMRYMVTNNAVTYMQLIRDQLPKIFDETYEFDPNKAKILQQGSDVTLVTTGYATVLARTTYEECQKAGVNIEHIHYPSVKPFDVQTLITSAQKTGAVITVENQNTIGGLGSAVCEHLASEYPVKVTRLGIQDQFGEVGSLEYLADKFKISPKHIVDACMKMSASKK
jgi:transketolase